MTEKMDDAKNPVAPMPMRFTIGICNAISMANDMRHNIIFHLKYVVPDILASSTVPIIAPAVRHMK